MSAAPPSPPHSHNGDAPDVPLDVDDNSVATPRDESDAEEESLEGSVARTVVKLKDIKTLTELYASKHIKPVQPKSNSLFKRGSSGTVRFPPDPALLERVSLFQGDITKMQVDSIVNAANRSLLGGGGVDGAIHNAAGPMLLAECRTLGGCETGFSKITRAYDLPSNYIIHTVGPIYGNEVELKAAQLASCYRTSLEVAVENSIKEVAFPSISTGIYGYPIEDATHVALNEVRNFLESGEGNAMVERVIFVVWSDKDRDVYQHLLPEYFPPGEKPSEEATVEAKLDPEPAADAEDPAASKPAEAAANAPPATPEST